MRKSWMLSFLVCGLFLVILQSYKGNVTSVAAVSPRDAGPNTKWVGTWATAPQLTETYNMPTNSLSNNTLRQVVRVSIGGNQIRLKFSNEYGTTALTMNAVHLAVSTGGSSIDPATDQVVTFGGRESVTIAPGATVTSDTLDYSLPPLSKMAITIYFGSVPDELTGHPGSRRTSYIQAGNVVTAADLTPIESPVHWYIITGIDVYTEEACEAIVTLGDSITDGRGSTTDGDNRWTDCLLACLQANSATAKIAMLNQGIGGNAILTGGLGPTALDRFDRDVLGQSGARYLIIFEGINDIGGATTDISSDLINAYKLLIAKARAQKLLVYGGTLLPCGNHSYYTELHETIRQTVNAWIRETGAAEGGFDAVIDFDAALRDATNPQVLASAYDSGDGLHPGVTGHQRMAEIIDCGLFKIPCSSPSPSPSISAIVSPSPSLSLSSSPSSSPSISATISPSPSGVANACTLIYTTYDLGRNAVVAITIRNKGSQAINGWTLNWNFPGKQRITSIRNARYIQKGNRVTVKNPANNAIIPAKGSVSFNFNISYQGRNVKPSGFILNGQPCQVR